MGSVSVYIDAQTLILACAHTLTISISLCNIYVSVLTAWRALWPFAKFTSKTRSYSKPRDFLYVWGKNKIRFFCAKDIKINKTRFYYVTPKRLFVASSLARLSGVVSIMNKKVKLQLSLITHYITLLD